MLNILINEPEPASSALRWFVDRLLPTLLSGLAIAVVASYLLPRFNERYRSRREYMLKDVDALRTQLDSLLKVAASYWRLPDDTLEPEIDYRLRDIAALVESCAADLWSSPRDRGPALVARLYLVCGTEHFWSDELPTADPDRVRRIAETVGEMSEVAVLARRHYLVPTKKPKQRVPRYGS